MRFARKGKKEMDESTLTHRAASWGARETPSWGKRGPFLEERNNRGKGKTAAGSKMLEGRREQRSENLPREGGANPP